ncbi:MAG: AmmeMemoRadiSam system protein B [Candidatus Villigracilaceae bacterium]
MAISSVRPSPIAGTWYEDRPAHLAKQIDSYLDHAELPYLPGEVVALIAPHAGHRYSGAVAAYAFATVRGRTYDLVAVIAPMHHFYPQPLLTTAHRAYLTPLGEIPVDHLALNDLNDLLKPDGLNLTAVLNDPEHSLEIELPFLQRALTGPFNLLPVMVRSQEPFVSQALGEALAKLLHGRNALLVASTDLSHFYPQEIAKSLDAEMLRCIESFSPQAVFEAEQSGRGFACGHAAVAAVLWAARDLGANQVKILKHATSGDVTGDYTQVVGYGAAAVLRL